MEEGEVVELLRKSLTLYQNDELQKASQELNKVHLEVYESTTQFRDMNPVDAVSLMATIRIDFPSDINKGSESWNRHYRDMLRAIRELAESYLNTV